MKKTLLSMLLAASCFGVANAQIVTDNNNNVGIHVPSGSSMNSYFSVNSLGTSEATSFMLTNSNLHRVGLYVRRAGSHPKLNMYQVAGQFTTEVFPSQYNIGVHAKASSSTALEAGRTYGVLAFAGNATPGYNYALFGCLNGVNNGAGVYGSSYADDGGLPLDGRYAGFFRGNLRVTENLTASTINATTITATTVTTPSDYRLKENIKSLSDGTLDNIMGMNVVEYNYIAPAEAELCEPDTLDGQSVVPVKAREVKLATPQPKHVGLIAQELQTMYPHLVVENEDGYLGINYMEIIPLLVSAVQELNTKLEHYENAAPRKTPEYRFANDTDLDVVCNILYQNEPNPFSKTTYIKCDISSDVTNAVLYIYNMNGEQIEEYVVTERGKTEVAIDGGMLNPGMYLYALIADGTVVDTKRMILTK